MEKFTGKVWVLGDDIDTDIIIPTEYLALKTIDDMKQYGFSPLRPEPENRHRRSSKRWESSVLSRNLLPEFSSETLSTTVFF